MPKGRSLAAFVATLLLAGCSSAGLSVGGSFPTEGGKLGAQARPPSPEEDPSAPGQIPHECEELLNKSQSWGFLPEKGWAPATPAVALEAAAFFSRFHLVPESTSNFSRLWLEEPAPATAAEAQKSLARLDRAQSCDTLLAHKLLLSLLAYSWPKAQRAEVAHDFVMFVLNQQARVAPSFARAVQLDVLGKAVEKRFVRAKARDVKAIRKWFDAETAKKLAAAGEAPDALARWKLSRDELRVSEEARDRLSRVLPLP
jgi:hypothetical protein